MSGDLEQTLFAMGKSLAWSVVAAVSFAFAMGLSIKVFDWMSKDINEWEEIKKGNIGVSLIFVAIQIIVLRAKR